MRYLNDITSFRGTGQKNEKGQTLEEFLDAYDPKKYDCPSNTADIAVFRKCTRRAAKDSGGCGLQLLMIRRGNHPNIGYWALPGGFVNLKENLETAAARELMEETGVTGVPLKMHSTWGDYDRDPRWRVITTLFFTILEEDVPVKAGDDAADAAWFDVTLEETAENADSTCLALRLENAAGGIVLEAAARCSFTGSGILRSHHLTPESNHGIAGDHALLIMDVARDILAYR